MKFHKNIRLKDYDYKTNGYYFVTVCTKSRMPLLEKCRYGSGAIAIAQAINKLSEFIKGLSIDWFVVMDNHIHIIFILEDCAKSLGQIVRAMKYNITQVVTPHRNTTATKNSAKGNSPATVEHRNAAAIGVVAGLQSRDNSSHSNATATIWQQNYYEHIIRNEKALAQIRKYIENNPLTEQLNWKELDVAAGLDVWKQNSSHSERSEESKRDVSFHST